jgi:H+/Cl- antiporter ClcA
MNRQKFFVAVVVAVVSGVGLIFFAPFYLLGATVGQLFGAAVQGYKDGHHKITNFIYTLKKRR